MQFLWLGLGLAVLLVAGDLLVRGAVALARRLGIPALIVSLTIVAFGTSAPELLISVLAVLHGAPGIALGNVVGSNIANVLLVLGLPGVIAGLITHGTDTRRSYVLMLGATLVFIGLCFAGPIRWPHALILLAGLAWMLWDAISGARAHRADARIAAQDEIPDAMPQMGWGAITGLLALGLAGLPLGAKLLVDNATLIAQAMGVSDAVIGLTLVAVGTSLPELATSAIAAFRNHAEVALGNVIGSNLFNLLGIIGVAGLVGPIPVPPQMLRLDLWVMLGAALLLIPFVHFGKRVGRRWGFGLLGAYGAYMIVLLH